MGEIRLSIGQVNITGYLRINFREVDNDTVILPQSEVIPPPVPAVINEVWTGFNNVVHYIDFRESPDGVAQGILLATFVYDVKNQTLLAERRYYTTDGGEANDPVTGDTSITDPYLDGANVTGVFKEGFRYLKPTAEFEHSGSVIDMPSVPALNNGEVLTVEITYTVNVPSGNGSSFPADIIERSADFAIDSSMLGNMIEINGSAEVITGTMPDPLTLPDNAKIAFNTDNGTQRYFAIPLSGGYAWVGGEQRTTLYMAQGEQLTMIKKGSYWRILSWTPGNHARVGEVVKSSSQPVASTPETGGWKSISLYPRIFYWHVNELPPTVLGVGTYPTPPLLAHMTKYCIDLVNGYFWVPNTQGFFDRNTDFAGSIDTGRAVGDRKPNTNQQYAIQSHQHFTFYNNGSTSNKTPLSETNSPVKMQGGGTDIGNANYEYSICGDNNQPNYGRSSAVGDSETRPSNVNRNSYIII